MEQEINGKVQKINEEDYEIIKKLETDGPVLTEKWYQNEYECSFSDAHKTISEIRNKYNVLPVGSYKPTEKDIVERMKEEESPDAMTAWIREEYGCSEKEALQIWTTIDFSKYDQNDEGGGKSGSGCMITVLIAIASTLSLFFMI